MVNDISTDESMQHIQFDDIKSRGSDDDQLMNYNAEEDNKEAKDSQKRFSDENVMTMKDRKRHNLEAIKRIQNQKESKTPLQHYEQLRTDGIFQMKDSISNLKPIALVGREKEAQDFINSQQVTEDKNKIFEVLNYEDNKEPDEISFLQVLKDKYRIDGLIAQTYKNVFQDNLFQIINYQN